MERTVTFNERQAIEDLLQYLRKDKDRLVEMFREQMDRNMMEQKEAIKRLRVLDEIDRKILEPVLPPITEALPTSVVIDGGASIKEMVDNFNKNREEQEKDTPKPFVYDREKERMNEQKYRANKRAYRKGTPVDMEVVTKETVEFLKETGRPVKTKEVLENLRSNGHKLNSPYSVFQQIREREPRIQSVTKGFYQYKF